MRSPSHSVACKLKHHSVHFDNTHICGYALRSMTLNEYIHMFIFLYSIVGFLVVLCVVPSEALTLMPLQLELSWKARHEKPVKTALPLQSKICNNPLLLCNALKASPIRLCLFTLQNGRRAKSERAHTQHSTAQTIGKNRTRFNLE